MPQQRLAGLAAALLLCLMAAGPAAACTLARVGGIAAPLPDGAALNRPRLDAAILAQVNFARCRAGRAALSPAPPLERIAEAQARWMAQRHRLTHEGGPPGLSSLSARLAASGLAYRTGGENIATASAYRLDGITIYPGKGPCRFRDASGRPVARQSYASLAAEVVARWLASPGHRRNILNPRFRFTAAAAGFDRAGQFCGTFYLAQLFVG